MPGRPACWGGHCGARHTARTSVRACVNAHAEAVTASTQQHRQQQQHPPQDYRRTAQCFAAVNETNPGLHRDFTRCSAVSELFFRGFIEELPTATKKNALKLSNCDHWSTQVTLLGCQIRRVPAETSGLFGGYLVVSGPR